MSKEKTALTPLESTDHSLAIFQIDQQVLSNIFEKNFIHGKLQFADLIKDPMAQNGRRTLEHQTASGEVQASSKRILWMAADAQQRTMWPPSDQAVAGARPLCHSADGLTGVGDPGGQCKFCVHAITRECAQRGLIFYLCDDEVIPRYMSLPQSSLWSWRNYKVRLTNKRLSYTDVLTGVTVEAKTSKTGNPYSVLQFGIERELSPQGKNRAQDFAATWRLILEDQLTQNNDTESEDVPTSWDAEHAA